MQIKIQNSRKHVIVIVVKPVNRLTDQLTIFKIINLFLEIAHYKSFSTCSLIKRVGIITSLKKTVVPFKLSVFCYITICYLKIIRTYRKHYIFQNITMTSVKFVNITPICSSHRLKNTDINCTKHNTYNKRRNSDIEFDESKLIIWHFNRLEHFFYVNYSNLI